MRKTQLVFIGLLILLIALKVWWIESRPILSTDEFTHLYLAQYIVQNHSIFLGSGELISHYGTIYLPAFHIFMALFLSWLPIHAVRYIIAIGIPLVTTWFVWRIFYKYDQSGIIALLMNFVPIYFVDSSMLYQEGFLIMLSVMTIYYLFESKWTWIIPYAIALFTKPMIPFMIAIPVAYHFYTNKMWTKLTVLISVSSIMAIVQYWFITTNIIYQNTLGYASWSMPFVITTLNYNSFNILWTLLMTGAVYCIAFMPLLLKNHKTLCVWFIAWMLPMLTGIALDRRYVFVAPLVFPFAYIALKENAEKYIRWMIPIMLIVFISQIYGLSNYYSVNTAWNESLDYIRQLPDNAIIATPDYTNTAYASNKSIVFLDIDMNHNNATHLVLMRAWFNNFNDTDAHPEALFYKNMKPDPRTLLGNGWSLAYNKSGIEILQRDTFK